MPPMATNIVNLGDQWFEFDWNGNRYLFNWRRGSHGEISTSVALTKGCSCGKLCIDKEVKSEGPGLVE